MAGLSVSFITGYKAESLPDCSLCLDNTVIFSQLFKGLLIVNCAGLVALPACCTASSIRRTGFGELAHWGDGCQAQAGRPTGSNDMISVYKMLVG